LTSKTHGFRAFIALNTKVVRMGFLEHRVDDDARQGASRASSIATEPRDHRALPGATSSPTTPSLRVPPSRILLVASLGAFLAFLDSTIVEVAFPSMRASFPESSLAGLSWVLNGYNIAFAALIVVFGRMTDLIGRRRSFVTGTLVFTLASVGCALASTVEALVVARVVQGMGGAMMVPVGLLVILHPEFYGGGSLPGRDHKHV